MRADRARASRIKLRLERAAFRLDFGPAEQSEIALNGGEGEVDAEAERHEEIDQRAHGRFGAGSSFLLCLCVPPLTGDALRSFAYPKGFVNPLSLHVSGAIANRSLAHARHRMQESFLHPPEICCRNQFQACRLRSRFIAKGEPYMSRSSPRSDLVTHEVTSQPTARGDLDLWAQDPALICHPCARRRCRSSSTLPVTARIAGRFTKRCSQAGRAANRQFA